MQNKYMVEIYDDDGELKKFKMFQTRKEITHEYAIPLYMVDKIIKMSNDTTFTTKRKPHKIYCDLVKSMKIVLIKPDVA